MSGGTGQKLAPDFTLPNVKGEQVTLSKVLDGERRVLLIFLRHLG